MTTEEQWYTNKDIFAMVRDLEKTLGETNTAIRKYNGVHEKIVANSQKINEQIALCAQKRAEEHGKSESYGTLIKIWPVLITTVMAVFTIWISTR